jgi:hypothetical protein
MDPDDVRLKRVLEWLREDLTHVDDAGRDRAVAILSAAQPRHGWPSAHSDRGADLSTAALVALQGQLRKGIAGLLRVEPPGTLGFVWELPGPQRATLRNDPFGDRDTAYLDWFGDPETTILHGVAQLVQAHRARLRLCKECQRPFLAVKRQEYDTPLCAQVYRNRTKATPTKETR